MLLSSGSCTLHFAFGETNMIAHRLTCVALSLDEDGMAPLPISYMMETICNQLFFLIKYRFFYK